MIAAPFLGVFDIALEEGSSAEFTAPDDEGVFEEAAHFQIFDQRGGGAVGVGALDFELGVEVAVLIPTGVHELDEFHTALGESAGHQAVVGEGALAFHIGAVHVENGLRFVGKIGEFGHAGLHAESHFILADARGDFRVAEVLEFGFVEFGDVVEEAAPDFAAHTIGIGEVQNGVTTAPEFHTLKFAG